MNEKELAASLNKALPEPVFRELTRFLDEGSIHDLYDAMAEIDSVRHPEDYSDLESDKIVVQFF